MHHPVAVEDYYEDQKEESKRRAESYRKNRLPKFLAHFEKVLECNPANKEGGTYLVGSRTTNADLVLFHVGQQILAVVNAPIHSDPHRLSMVQNSRSLAEPLPSASRESTKRFSL